jgi:hypothetical protein
MGTIMINLNVVPWIRKQGYAQYVQIIVYGNHISMIIK